MGSIPSITDKCTGALLASAIGDALGWPNEFRAKNISNDTKGGDCFLGWTRRTGGKYWNHYEKILPGEYSDDTQLILAVARSLIAGDWENVFINKELPFWLEYERGGGSAVKNAAKALKYSIMPWESKDAQKYFNAGGNGATMRILPHVITGANQYKRKELIAEVVKNSILTHGHPRAILGAACYAYVLHELLKKQSVLGFGELINCAIEGREQWGVFPDGAVPVKWIECAKRQSGYDYSHVWSLCVTDMMEKLNFIGDSLKKGLLVNDEDVLKKLECFDRTNGAGDVAILSAIYLVSKYANNPTLGIKIAAFSFGADTDTIASITGGLFGMLYGVAWIPTEWRLVQDYDCFVNIAQLLLADDMKEATRIITSQNKFRGHNWEPSPLGKMRMLNTSILPSGKSAEIIVRKMITLLGQTFYIKKYERKSMASYQVSYVRQEDAQYVLDLPNNEQTVFSISAYQLKELKSNPLIGRITLKKTLKIVEAVITNNADYISIANNLKTDRAIVELIGKHVKLIRKENE